MVLETDPVAFSAWLPWALLFFAQAAALLALAALAIGYLVAAFRYGPLVGGDLTFRVVKTVFREATQLSPRRVFALSRLAIQESLRRRVLVAFGLFLLILLFAGWFLDANTNDPAKLYLSFVLTATTYLVLVLALFLSAFSLPADFKNRTIYTIVTKPVRAGEIVLGRILGFTAIGTLLIAIMGLFSYFFVVRVLNHTHEVDLDSLVSSASATSGSQPARKTGRTSLAQNHRHQVDIGPDNRGATDIKNGHWHDIVSVEDGGKLRYELSEPRGMFVAVVPHYGELRFHDRTGKPASKGVNVGNEWGYRSYIQGGTAAAAIWKFKGVTREAYPNGLPVEMTIRVFRTYQGKIEKGILGSLVLKNPKTGLASRLHTFTAKDFHVDHLDIPVKLSDPKGRPLDLFDDLVQDGEVEIWLQSIPMAQYFGAARPDLYLRAGDASFTGNFVKGYLGIWLQMVLVTCFGVMFSTFLSGPVAMMATLAVIVMGLFTNFIFEVAQGKIKGGGPVESFIRLVTQQNVMTPREEGFTTTVVTSIDAILMTFMQAIASLVPDFGTFSNVDYLAYGFNIPGDRLLIQGFSVLAYLAVVFVVGYFFLRTRETAR